MGVNMSSRGNQLVVLLVLLYGSQALADDWWTDCPPPFKWSVCDIPNLPFKADSVSLMPDPPVIGVDALFGITGQYTGAPVEASSGSTIEIAVSYAGEDIIYTETDLLCEKTTCPIQTGPIEFSYVQNLPPIAPPGCYKVEVTARNGDDVLMCVDVYFNMTYPDETNAASSLKLDSTSKGAAVRRQLPEDKDSGKELDDQESGKGQEPGKTMDEGTWWTEVMTTLPEKRKATQPYRASVQFDTGKSSKRKV